MGRVAPESPPARCPFVGPGLDVALCPGCCPEVASTRGLGMGGRVVDWMTCRHLRATVLRRGDYYPGCHHPDGLPLAPRGGPRTTEVAPHGSRLTRSTDTASTRSAI